MVQFVPYKHGFGCFEIRYIWNLLHDEQTDLQKDRTNCICDYLVYIFETLMQFIPCFISRYGINCITIV